MHKHLTALFLFCITFSALATEPNDHWLQVQSPHFVVLTDSNEKQARRLAAQFEQMRSVFHVLFPNAASDTGSPLTLLPRKDPHAFPALAPDAYLPQNPLNLA